MRVAPSLNILRPPTNRVGIQVSYVIIGNSVVPSYVKLLAALYVVLTRVFAVKAAVFTAFQKSEPIFVLFDNIIGLQSRIISGDEGLLCFVCVSLISHALLHLLIIYRRMIFFEIRPYLI